MRSKLSQPLDQKGGIHGALPSDRTESDGPQYGSGGCTAASISSCCPAIAILFLVITTACPLPNRSSEIEAGNSASSVRTNDRGGATRDEFQWPSDVDHFRMRLEVVTQDSEGTIEIELMPELAPASVEELIQLTRDGHYDGTTFHRVIRGFMIQGGDPNTRDHDPTNDGRGSAARPLPDEFSTAPFVRGIVALARRGRADSNDSQFFILQSDHRDLDGQYTAIGRVVSGIDYVDAIANTPTDKVGRWGPKDRPIENVSIRRAVITGPKGHDLSHSPDPASGSQPIHLSRSVSAPSRSQ
jgi:peptidyl-prolyl cis-trans isomerase B (cyclophilin B)